MRLNGWHRIGITISLIWVFSVSVFAAVEYLKRDERNNHYFLASVHIPIPSKERVSGQGYSYEELMGYRVDYSLRLARLLAVIIIPAPIFWLSPPLLAYSVRWIAKGFKENEA